MNWRGSTTARLRPTRPGDHPLPIRWGERWGEGCVRRAASVIGWKCFRLSLALLLGGFLSAQISAKEKESAQLKISGYGFFGNRELKGALKLLQRPGQKPRVFDGNFIEDAALILISTLKGDGYLEPKIKARVTLEDGSSATYVWDQPIEEPLPRPLRARKVHFQVQEGVLYSYERIHFKGLQSLKADSAREYFIQTGTILPLKRTRIYTPQRLDRSMANLSEVLARNGHEQAQVSAASLQRNDRTGRVQVRVKVHEGPKSIVRSVRQETFYGETNLPAKVGTVYPNQPFSKLWLQDFAQALKNTNYLSGYPDTMVEVTTLKREATDDLVYLDLLARIKTGPQITLGQVKFGGHQRTKEWILRRRVDLDEGEFLNRVQAEQGRIRLMRLGIFDSVDLSYEPADAQTRDVRYELKESKRIDISLLLGYGSYELLRGGFEIQQYNVFGLAHNSRLRAVQSFKSSSADYIYTMPGLLPRDVDLFLNASGLRREEVSFTREEFGGGAGVRRYFKPLLSDVSVRYNYQIIEAQDTDIDITEDGVESARVASIILDVKHDRRDNPLYPHKGYKVFSNFEVASEALGGEVDFERLEIAASYHQPLDAGRWLHFGLSHGAVVTMSGSAEDLPFNKRFFLGGENTVRGYQQGEASPRNERGKIVGAETYLSGNFEFEQAVTPSWSIVAFFDVIGIARDIQNYPFDETLYSVGGGLRWRTLIGPVRLEYGHNLKRRAKDPAGTLHVSIGFPF